MESIKAYRSRLQRQVADASPSTAAAAKATLPSTEMLLTTLADSSATADARLSALSALQVHAFASPDAAMIRPRLVASLRVAARDSGVNLAALGVLVNLNDADTREHLIEGLRDPSKALVKPAEAFRLLSGDQHGDAIDLAREAVDGKGDAETVEAALPLLARDPSSTVRLRRILADRAAPIAHRKSAAQALFALDRDALADVRDATADNQQLGAFTSGLLGAKVDPKPKMAKHVRKVKVTRKPQKAQSTVQPRTAVAKKAAKGKTARATRKVVKKARSKR